MQVGLQSARCDESGLCETLDRIRVGRVPRRCIGVDNETVALVDISPVQPGHVLISPHQHAASTQDLAATVSDAVWAHASEISTIVASLVGKPVVLIEHGVSARYTGPSCVRHAHAHVCPVDLQGGEAAAVLGRSLDELRFSRNRRLAQSLVSGRDSYVVGQLGEQWFSGIPRSGIRQVTRVMLSALTQNAPRDVDWICGALGENYRASLDLFGLAEPDFELAEEPW